MEPIDLEPVQYLAFRRQFVLSQSSTDLLPGWIPHQVAGDLVLSVHPDLSYTRADANDRSVLLLGFVLDPRHPDRDNQTILSTVLQNTTRFDEILREFDAFAGRWAAIYVAGGQVLLFHDPAGLRPVYHWRDDHGSIWCASSPNLLSLLTGVSQDVGANRKSLSRGGALRTDRAHFWPGSGSAFLDVDRLLPNHYLDLRSGKIQRYWPRAPIPLEQQDVARIRCADTLTGVISAAAARYPLALAMTAGLDSRLLLAASRGCVENLAFYTLKKTGMNKGHGDIRIPRRMLKDLGLNHKVISVRQRSEGPVANAIHATFSPFHQSTADQAQALFFDPPRRDGEWVTINGNVCEIARYSEHRLFFRRCGVSPENLASSVGMGSSDYAVAQFGAWYENAKPVLNASGIDPWDLFYWEQKLGGWLATVRTEFDVVEEGVSPFNSRSLLECMLGVDASLRSAPDYPFFRGLIADLWPELLGYPMNPPARRTQLKAIPTAAITAGLQFIKPARNKEMP